MDKDDILAVASFAVVGLAAGWYLKVCSNERAKRQRIEAWKQSRLECVRNSARRMADLVIDPNVSIGEINAAWQEEQEFLNIVTDPATMDL